MTMPQNLAAYDRSSIMSYLAQVSPFGSLLVLLLLAAAVVVVVGVVVVVVVVVAVAVVVVVVAVAVVVVVVFNVVPGQKIAHQKSQKRKYLGKCH